jgi:hypothetical protein
MNEIKERKDKYEKDNKEINNKYKLKNKKEYMIYDFNIEKLEKKYNENIKNFQFEIKIENMINIKRINEVVYNTYDTYKNNYYNAVNINNILLSYHKNEYIKNKIMKKNLKNNYEEILKKILKKNEEDIKYNSKVNSVSLKIKEEYKKKINELNLIKK